MSFFHELKRLSARPLAQKVDAATENAALRALDRPAPTPEDFLALLSPAAAPHLEAMAQRASRVTLQHFGRTVSLFTPLYLANHCANHCRYCGFNATTGITRSKLTLDEVRAEGEAIAATGLKHLLLLTGEAPKKAGVDYLESSLGVLRPLFPSLSIEVFPMATAEYARLVRGGVDGLTIFQETYNTERYDQLHPAGPKRDFRNRLDAPERGCEAGMRTVNIGALLGLDDWRRDLFLAGMHAAWLMARYPGVEVSLSLPRMRPHTGSFVPACTVSDRELVQAMAAVRLFLPRAGITISTREAPALRDNILGLGVTRMSAGVSTAVGGHAKQSGAPGQFEISDPRSVDEMCAALRARGFQPVFKDWEPIAEAAG